jgi:glycolate oxidase FAD binding subunit
MSLDNQDLPTQIIERSLGTGRQIAGDEKYRVDNHPIFVSVKPKDINEISALMKEAHAHDVSIMPVGGGTRLSLGNAAQASGIALDMTSLNSPVSINAADLTATFEAGMTLAQVQNVLAENNQFLALDASLSEKATIGGILASGTSGPLKWQYGNPRDLVIGMKVVQPDGTVTKSGGQVVKNVSGYDMARLHIGGIGTLGIIAEVGFKLTPKPAAETSVIAGFENTKDCGDAALAIFNSQVAPLALTTFDSSVLSRTGISDMAGDQFLAVRLGGRPRALKRLTDDTVKFMQEHRGSNIETLEGKPALDLWKHLADFGWVGESLPDVVIRASVVPNRVQPLVDAIKTVSTGMAVSYVASPGYGNVMVFWQAQSGTSLLESSKNAIKATRIAVGRLDGSAIIERCPVESKSRIDVWGGVGESIEIMRRMKQQYDPKGILNPGRFIGGI